MCYPKPGPRCSAHAKARHIALRQARSEMRRKGVYLSWEEESVLEAELKAAELDFDSTPVGQARLELRLTQEMDYDGSLAERLAHVKELRRLQLEAVKATDAGDIHNHGDNGVQLPKEELKGRLTRRKNLRESPAGRKKIEAYIEYSKNFSQHLSTEEANALYWHTSDGSGTVNEILHKKYSPESEKWTYENLKRNWGNRDKYSKKMIEKQVKTLDGVFARHSLPEPVVLYRGFGKNNLPDQLDHVHPDSAEMKEYLAEKYPLGETIDIPEYMSTSLDPAVAHKFAGYEAMVLEIKTKRAVPVAMMSAWDESEREFVVNRNGKYRVVNVLKNVTYEDVYITSKTQKSANNKKVTVIQLEEV